MDHDLTLYEIDLSTTQCEEVERMAACGLTARQIAVGLELSAENIRAFCRMASVPGSQISELIDSGRMHGQLEPQLALQRAAAMGNIEAVRELSRCRRDNLFNELLTNMDDDELTM